MDFTLVLPVVLGWLAGLFINYAADVLPHTRRFSQPVCRDCQTPSSWIDYLTFRACRNCGILRSLRTWIVQILTPATFVYFWLSPDKHLNLPLGMLVLTYFGLIIVIDLEHRLILFSTSLAGAMLGLVTGTYIHSKVNSLPAAVGISLLGGIFGFIVLLVLYQAGTLVARYRARRLQANGREDDEEEALGGGDVYLAGVLGLMIGWPLIWEALVRGVLLGALVSLILVIGLLARRRYLRNALMTFIPYGPYFILSAFYVLFIL